MSNIEINCEKYTNFQRIGMGTIGSVYKAEKKNSKYNVAIKEIDKEKYNKSNKEILKEIEMINKLKCENSVLIKNTIDTKKYFYIIMDYCQLNLEEYIMRRETQVSVNEIKQVLLQLNNVFKIIKTRNIIHKNLTPNNILISLDRLDKLLIKLSDYGFSKQDSEDTSINENISLCLAPEIINAEENLMKSDLWSLGVIIYYMYFKEYPFNGKNEFMLLKDIQSNKKLKTTENNELNDLINKLLKINTTERLSWEEYFNHSFFKNDDKDITIIKLKEQINKLENEIKVMKKNKNKKEEIDSNKHFKLELKDPLILNEHKGDVLCLTLLNDGRLVSGSLDSSIIIYNKSTYKSDLIIKEHKDRIWSLVQFKNGYLSSCSSDKTIKLFNIQGNKYKIIQTLNFHSDNVYKIIELSNNSLVSGSDDLTIIFYKKDDSKYKKDYVINASDSVRNIIQTKQNEIVYSTYDNKINFFDLIERKNKKIIEDVTSSFNSFCMITKDLLLIPGYEIISVINLNNYSKIREIEISKEAVIRGICMLTSNLIIIGDENGTLKEYKIEGDNLRLFSKKGNAHENNIYNIVKLDNNHFATCSGDTTIKIW